MDRNNEVIEELKKVTIEEIMNILVNNISNNEIKKEKIEEQKNILSINEIVKEYPMFSRYSIEKAIKENGLPFIKLGNKKFFEREAVDNWLLENNTTLGKKKNYDL